MAKNEITLVLPQYNAAIISNYLCHKDKKFAGNDYDYLKFSIHLLTGKLLCPEMKSHLSFHSTKLYQIEISITGIFYFPCTSYIANYAF